MLTPGTATASPLSWWEQATTDRALALVGAVLGIVGLVVTIALAARQLNKTRKAAEAAEAASTRTRQVLRTSDLSRVLVESMSIGSRISGASVRQVQQAVDDWMLAYQRISALLRQRSLPEALTLEVVDRLEVVHAELLVVIEASASRPSWIAYNKAALRAVLSKYGAAVEVLLLSAEDNLLGEGQDHG